MDKTSYKKSNKGALISITVKAYKNYLYKRKKLRYETRISYQKMKGKKDENNI